MPLSYRIPSSRSVTSPSTRTRLSQSGSAAGTPHFSVFASFNALDYSLAQYRDSVLKNLDAGSVVTYQAQGRTDGNDWFVISGTKGDDIFYEKHRLSYRGEMIEGLIISYPASMKATYDPIVARMAKSFRSGSGFQTPRSKQ